MMCVPSCIRLQVKAGYQHHTHLRRTERRSHIIPRSSGQRGRNDSAVRQASPTSSSHSGILHEHRRPGIDAGAEEICLKDMAGIGQPAFLGKPIKMIKDKHPEIIIQYHGHSGPGLSMAHPEVWQQRCRHHRHSHRAALMGVLHRMEEPKP